MRLRIIASNQVGQRLFPHVPHTQSLAQVNIPISIDVYSLWVKKIFARTGCELVQTGVPVAPSSTFPLRGL